MNAAITATPSGEQSAQQSAASDPGKGEPKAPADGFHTGGIDTRDEQPAIMTRVPPDDVEQNGRQFKREAVEDDSSALPVTVTELLGQNGGGERQERDVHQQRGVQEQHYPVGATDVVEHD